MDELLKMSNPEITRLETMQRIKDGRLTLMGSAMEFRAAPSTNLYEHRIL
ncbi:MAG: hypothetical protein ACK4SN_04750 [Bellilinea sp.]